MRTVSSTGSKTPILRHISAPHPLPQARLPSRTARSCSPPTTQWLPRRTTPTPSRWALNPLGLSLHHCPPHCVQWVVTTTPPRLLRQIQPRLILAAPWKYRPTSNSGQAQMRAHQTSLCHIRFQSSRGCQPRLGAGIVVIPGVSLRAPPSPLIRDGPDTTGPAQPKYERTAARRHAQDQEWVECRRRMAPRHPVVFNSPCP